MLEMALVDISESCYTFLSSCEDVQGVEREQHECGRELVAKKPEL